MSELKQHHHWRWASLAAVLTFLALVVVGGYAVAAQAPSNPAASELGPYDLQIDKWSFPGSAQPGGVFAYGIWYGNVDQPGTAEGVTIIDTLPPGTTYAGDTSGLPVTLGAGTVTWNVGTLEPGQTGIFVVTLGIPSDTIAPGVIDPNQAAIAPDLDDVNPGNNEAASEPVDIIPPVEVDLDVGKNPEPGDPTPGEEFQYSVNWCNNSKVAVGPVTLIDTLPDGTHYVDWYLAQPWQRFWNEVSADDSALVLEAPGVPGNWCQQLYIVLQLDASVPISSTLENQVEIHVDGDANPTNDSQINADAHASPPRADLMVSKGYNGGELVQGGWIEYGGRYWNQGNVPVEAELVDTLQEGLTYRLGSTRMNGEPFADPAIDGQELTWALGTVPVNQGADFSFVADIDLGAPLGEFGNCIEISHDQVDDSPWDNESCVGVQIWPSGPNLHVEKWSQWNRDNIYYWFFAANLGDVAVDNIIIIDSYPEGTEPMGDPGVPMHLQGKTGFHFEDPYQLVFEITDLQPGEGGWFDFSVGGIDPDVKPAEFHNIIEISGDLLPGEDVNEADNFDDDLIVIPAIDRVELFLEPDGQSSMWGEAIAGQVVTVTTPFGGEFTTTVGIDECTTCWEIQDTGIVNEDDEIEVDVSGVDPPMPVLFTVPSPFTAVLDRTGGTVSGQIGGWEEQPVEVRGWWDGGWQQLITDAGGNYEAVYGDPIPPGAEGVTYFETMVNYTQVTYRRHFRDMSLLLQVNYDHDWIQGGYEAGHTVWLTVTKGVDVYTTAVTTEYSEGWENGGFSSDWGEWDPERPNIEPGDLVEGEVDNGYTAILTVGEITGWVDADNDRIDGTVNASFLLPTAEVDVECHPWGAPEGAPNKWSSAGVEGDPPYSCAWDPTTEWDVMPGQDIAVSYYEPAGHQVFGVFSTPWMRVNYGDDWVGGNYPLGHTFVVTVTDQLGTEKGIADAEVTSDGGWGGSGFETNEDNWRGGSPPDIVPGDLVHFFTEGYENIVQVGDIGGVVDVEGDTISGPIHAEWFGDILLDVECHPWGGPGEAQPKSSSAGSLGAPEYLCDWSGEWDIVAGQDIGVMYIEPDDGDRVINAFHEPAPDMSVDKQPAGSDQFAPGGRAVFWIGYHNNGDAVADPAILVDTLPPGATYVEDTSDLPVTPGPGTVEWDLGTVPPGEGGQFYLVVQLPDPALEELTNVVDIFADFDPNEGNNHAEATIYRTEPYVELYVNKNPTPGDPTPGSTYVYEIEYGNNGTTPSGPATLTDIVPNIPGVCETRVVDWYSQNGYDLWTDVSADNTELVLTAPALPGRWGDRIVLRLKVDDACPTEPQTQLVNLVTLEAPDAYAEHENGDAWTSGPYTNAHLEKGFGWGVLVPGGEIGYNLHVANHGNLTATVTLTDVLPIGTSFIESWSGDGREYGPIVPSYIGADIVTWDLGEIDPGSWMNIELHLAIDPGLEANDVLTNCAEIMVEEGDVFPDDNAACRTDDLREDGPNLRIYKDYRWNWEGQIQYDITFQNVGTEPLFDVEIVDTLPAGTSFSGEWDKDFWQDIDYDPLGPDPRWIIPVLEPGWSSRLWFNANLDSPEQGMIYTNLAEAEVVGDVWPDDNTSEVTAYTGPDIFIEKWLSGGEVRPGEIVTFTVEFGNRNKWPWGTDPGQPDPATTIVDILPAELTFVRATAPWNPDEEWVPADYDETTNTVTWDFGQMHPESWWTFQIVVQVAEDAEEDAVIVNTVQAYSNSGNDVDPLPGNNTFDLELVVGPPDYIVYLPLVLKNH